MPDEDTESATVDPTISKPKSQSATAEQKISDLVEDIEREIEMRENEVVASTWLAQSATIKKKHRIQACEKLGLSWDEFEGQERLLTFATGSGLSVDDDVIEAISKMRLRIDEVAAELFSEAPPPEQRKFSLPLPQFGGTS